MRLTAEQVLVAKLEIFRRAACRVDGLKSLPIRPDLAVRLKRDEHFARQEILSTFQRQKKEIAKLKKKLKAIEDDRQWRAYQGGGLS